jgi:hypothetical protein
MRAGEEAMKQIDPATNPCYTRCDECQRHECGIANKCLRELPEKEEWNRANIPVSDPMFLISGSDLDVIASWNHISNVSTVIRKVRENQIYPSKTKPEAALKKFANFVIKECQSNHYWEDSLKIIEAEAMKIKRRKP